MKITVTEQDILAGIRGDCGECPIAKAIARARGDDHVHVGCQSTFLSPDHNEDHPFMCTESHKVDLPAIAIEFVRQFDYRKNGDPFPKPFEFDIEWKREGE